MTYPFNKYFDICLIVMHLNGRLYWLDRANLKSSTTTGSDIKSHVIIKGATTVFVYKVIF